MVVVVALGMQKQQGIPPIAICLFFLPMALGLQQEPTATNPSLHGGKESTEGGFGVGALVVVVGLRRHKQQGNPPNPICLFFLPALQQEPTSTNPSLHGGFQEGGDGALVVVVVVGGIGGKLQPWQRKAKNISIS